MSNFVGRPPFLNSLWVAIETIQFSHSPNQIFFEDTFVSHQGGPNKQFGTHEKLSWGLQGNLNWMPGYITYNLVNKNVVLNYNDLYIVLKFNVQMHLFLFNSLLYIYKVVLPEYVLCLLICNITTNDCQSVTLEIPSSVRWTRKFLLRKTKYQYFQVIKMHVVPRQGSLVLRILSHWGQM